MRHYEITGPAALHQFCYLQNTDPALVPANGVTAGKAWLDTAEERLKIRSADNLQWVYLGEDGGL